MTEKDEKLIAMVREWVSDSCPIFIARELADRLSALLADRAQLVEALRPFAEAPDVLHVWNKEISDHEVKRPPDNERASIFTATWGDLRRARQALAASTPGGGEG